MEKLTYRQFLKTDADLSPLGVMRVDAPFEPYFCTPKGAAIFGWAGVDGIHYCFIRGFGGMVFAVSPMNAAPDCVHPLARDFADFLRLLLACGDAAALEQAWMWTEAQFEEYLREYPPTDEQRAKIEQTAQAILDARNLYPDCSLADLYDEAAMPPELRKAHQQNDKAVMQAYGFWGKLNTESACVAELMKMYQKLAEDKKG